MGGKGRVSMFFIRNYSTCMIAKITSGRQQQEYETVDRERKELSF